MRYCGGIYIPLGPESHRYCLQCLPVKVIEYGKNIKRLSTVDSENIQK